MSKYLGKKLLHLKGRYNESLEERASTGKVRSALFGDKRHLIKTFAVLTAENPMGKKLSDIENRQRNKSLRKGIEDDRRVDMEKSGLSKEDFFRRIHVQYIPIQGKFGNDEHSYIVINLSLDDAKKYSKLFGQMSFFFGEHTKDDKVIVSYYERAREKDDFELIEKTERIDNAQDFDDFFSKYNGLKWSFYLKYFNEGYNLREIINEDFLNKSLDDSYTMMGRALYRRRAYKESHERRIKEGWNEKKLFKENDTMRNDRNERIGNDLSEYQKWVDYDMKKYGRISDITKGKIRRAGLSIVKDQYGDYEVIADRPIKEKLREAKTKEIIVLQGNYGYGWDDLVSYETNQWREAKDDLNDYRENERDASHRLIRRRVPTNGASVNESCKRRDESCRSRRGRKLTEKRWRYELKKGKELRDAIEDGDYDGVLAMLQLCYQELADEGIIDQDDCDRYVEELDNIDTNEDDYEFTGYHYDDDDEDDDYGVEDEIDDALNNFYDLCDNIGVWVTL